MPRKSRIDVPGALHYIIARGIERSEMFRAKFVCKARKENSTRERLQTNRALGRNWKTKGRPQALPVCSDIHVLRDPTRGGVGTALNEIAGTSKAGIRIYEEKIPVKNEVAGICELLGFDPLYIANEGKLLAFVKPDRAEDVLAVMKEDKFGKDACIIGEVVSDYPGKVFMQTRIEGTRIVDMLAGEQLPRIC